MNKILLIISVLFLSSVIYAGTFEIRSSVGAEGYLYVEMRETSGTGTPQTTNQVTDIVFQVKWLSSLGNVDLGSVICTDYEIVKSGSRSTQGSYYYQEFYADNTPFAFPENWTQNTWVTIAKLEVGTGTGSGTFEIGEDSFVGTGVNIGVDLTDYTPTVNGSASGLDYPTTVWDLVWKGGGQAGFETDWFFSLNWENSCGGTAASAPNSTLNVYIPDVSSGSGHFLSSNLMGSMACKNLRIGSGGQFFVPSTNGSLAVSEKLHSDGTLWITPNADATVSGNTYLGAANCLIVQATSSGVGSFIDNGTITYGASGSAKVQTYLTNSAGSGNLDIHLVGPTVDQISGGTDGALLSAFNLVNGNTYAYEWDESVVNANGWVNIFDNNYVVNAGAGIGLSTDDGSANTLEMTGELMTGSISSPTLTFSNNHYELISNPYPSAIDFDNLASDNSSVVQIKYWIWDPSGGTYVSRSSGVGGSQYVQVGQGFFVETKTGGTFDFTNSRRAHSNTSFRNSHSNLLSINVTGGPNGYYDNTYVKFIEDATSGYDIEYDAIKWRSQNLLATQISTKAEDATSLGVNFMPLVGLGTNMISIPLAFECGFSNDYNLTFTDIDSFDPDVEIWLEDKLFGDQWIRLHNESEYTFTADPNDDPDRFILHFFGPTGINDVDESKIDIFGNRQHAYVRNNTNETIEKVSIYTLGGELLSVHENVDLMVNKYYVSDEIGYFIVRVVTNDNVYTEKVLISK